MTKEEAIKKWVNQEFDAMDQDWVERLFESFQGYAPKLPMWGTMWICNQSDGEKFWENSRGMASSPRDINLDEIEEKEGEEKRKLVEKAIEEDDWSISESYYDEEMAGERCVLDKDGDPTSVYIYELDGKYIIGVNGAGWDFYDGVWDRLYDVAELHWHKDEEGCDE